MPCHAMHPIQDLFLESFSYVLQIDMHFICTPMWTKFILVKSGCYNRYGPSNPGLIELKDLRAGTTSLGTALLETPMPVPCVPKSCSKIPVPPPSPGLALAISTPLAPCSIPPAPGASIANATAGHRWMTGFNKVQLLSLGHRFFKIRSQKHGK
jgi:hypothetical protein